LPAPAVLPAAQASPRGFTARWSAVSGANAYYLDVMTNNPGGAGSALWINEIHYDNTNGDVGEFVEVAGAAGVSLGGYKLVLYNGGGGAPYSTNSLSGTIGDESEGVGALSFGYAPDTIQNGSPDGVALVTPGNSVVQFLSYEGSFTAVGGPANGLVSTDIGVSETASTPAGYSVQLGGSGDRCSEFSWNAPATASPGSLNSGQAVSHLEYVPGHQDVNVGNVTASAVTGLSENSTYFYRVRAFGASGTSTSSAVEQVNTKPTAMMVLFR
jgi:hypothetical protein